MRDVTQDQAWTFPARENGIAAAICAIYTRLDAEQVPTYICVEYT